MKTRFSLAPMAPSILLLTGVLWLLPFAFAGHYLVTGESISGMVALLLVGLYIFVWACCRPSGFAVSETGLQIVFPAWTRKVPVRDIAGVSQISARRFKADYGWALRVGVGGLWGGFGWLWTSKQGMVEFYVSRTDGLVLIERRNGSNILLTPGMPEQIVSSLKNYIQKR